MASARLDLPLPVGEKGVAGETRLTENGTGTGIGTLTTPWLVTGLSDLRGFGFDDIAGTEESSSRQHTRIHFFLSRRSRADRVQRDSLLDRSKLASEGTFEKRARARPDHSLFAPEKHRTNVSQYPVIRTLCMLPALS